MRTALSLTIALLLTTKTAMAAAAGVEKPNEIFTKGDATWPDLLTDSASGSISAAGMLGVSGESVTPIENVRSLVVGLQGLSTNDDDEAFGLSLTPARTAIAPMDLSNYDRSIWFRLLGSLTASYAKGAASISDVQYERSAFAIDTNAFFNGSDDPVVAFARDGACNAIIRQEPEAPPPMQEPAAMAPVVAADTSGNGPQRPKDVTATADEIKKRLAQCRQRVMNGLRWNRSQLSMSYGEARIEPKDHSKPRTSFGRTMAVGLIYGFDRFESLSKRYALSLSYRQTDDEPVLDTLALAQTLRRDSSLLTARLTGGTQTSRIFIEVSDASSSQVTASQRAFKRALGVDFRIFEGTWLNVRVGRRKEISGAGEESGSLLSISYSPKALLPP